MITEHCYCIIMAGGSGTRFWPVSRTNKPKQFISVPELGNKTLLRDTYDRFSEIIPKENILIVTVAKYMSLVRDTIPELSQENLLVEPYGRDTAPCVAFATCKILQRDPEAVTIVSPADHFIERSDNFRETIIKATEFAEKNDVLLSLGLVPSYPDTNFGYIQAKGGNTSVKEAMAVKTFTEKPDEELAQIFVQSKEFFWNAGIFFWKARVIMEELQTCLPLLMQWFQGWESIFGTFQEPSFLERIYGGCDKISIAYGILEKTSRAWVYPANFGWYDVASWESFFQYNSDKKDSNGNCTLTNLKSSMVADSRNNLIISTTPGKLVAVRGVDNYIVIDTPDVLLVCPRDDHKVKELTREIAMPQYEKFR